ncbi:4Fe-4S dicluster domain-containing protein [Azoarcus sp. TTM-91]|uniref:4Fe-4S binding protein n=1 Tax=Azoarcus sp. TTM-91 TaxID=2691581 RepID=UPI00145E7568|nr:4Fe-4S binding protein [Azoarcus sp. TTM-91]NMG33557.1 4Fe-4S dicluster domain-containing protein [Azoarcus sp. TTM-91]
MALKIDPVQCTSCGMCESVCPTSSIAERKGVYRIDADGCTECDGGDPECMDNCPVDGCISYA